MRIIIKTSIELNPFLDTTHSKVGKLVFDANFAAVTRQNNRVGAEYGDGNKTIEEDELTSASHFST